ncbi:MAG: hypothetical protein M3N14_01650 [Bacteroidota bacterium]|nr:hypothetical protein [Bacteroidota bacterium]
MKKFPFTRQWLHFVALIITSLIFYGFQSGPQVAQSIILQDERSAITPKEFYIAGVVDEREDRAAVAYLLPAGADEKNQLKPVPVDIKGGGFVAVKQFILRNVPRNTTMRPVIVSLKKCMITESAWSDGHIEGHVSLVMAFNLEDRDDVPEGGLHLLDYNGSAIYNRSLGQSQDIEPTLRKVLENGIVYLNTWMNSQAGTNIKLAKAVKVTFEDYREKSEGDTLYYSLARPLRWDDFQSKTPSSRFDAEVFATMGYDEHNDVHNGVIYIHLLMKVCLPKEACWVKAGSRNDYTLNHEQRHFDIAKIASEKFKVKILKEDLPTGNFDGFINVDYLESYREMTEMQKLYDLETRHGSDHSAQERWNEYIDEELKKFGIK